MIYDIAFLVFALFYLPALILKGKLHRDFPERFGVFSAGKRSRLRAARNRIWIQAVSVGEVALCKELVRRLKENFPDDELVISTITRTGNGLARKLFSRDALVIYFPLDLSAVAKRVVSLIRPRLYIMIETEIWPNVLKALAGMGVPSVLINGRISDSSYGRYRLARPFLKSALERISAFCMRSATDAERIALLGAPAGRIRITGNMKFDAEANRQNPPDRQDMPGHLSDTEDADMLFVAGSTHEGEEEMLISAFGALRDEFPRLRLLIAPRHVERAAEIEALAKRAGFETARISSLAWEPGSLGVWESGGGSRVYILDTIGQLNEFYARADIVFIGGSLVRRGGHNPIEPAVFGKAVLFGPHMFNFKDVVKALLDAGGAVQVKDAGELASKMRDLLRDEKARSSLGERAKNAVLASRGATEKNLEAVKSIKLHLP
jgi:3-deoxy-D-manno-octulosonic-acid transferase